MDREKALKMVKEKVKTGNLVKHMLATEAIMRSLAKKLGEDEDKWALAGLLHDLDYEETKDDEERHGLLSAEMLDAEGVDAEIIHAVKAHAEKAERRTLMDNAICAVDPLTGLIVAAALIHPDKKLEAIDTGFVMNRFGEKSFARGADRNRISTCSDLGMELEEFIGLGLAAMQEIHEDLGL